MGKRINIGVEQVLYSAATDPAFCEALLASREEALAARGLRLSDGELALLQGVPDEQLLANIESMDVSPRNSERRSFLRTAAAGAMPVAAADALAACGGGDNTGNRPDLPDQAVFDAAPDTAPDKASPDSTADTASADTKKSPDKGWLDVKTSWGSRPGG